MDKLHKHSDIQNLDSQVHSPADAQARQSKSLKLMAEIMHSATQLGFSAVGCARAEAIEESVEAHRYKEAQEKGWFGQMEYLSRNADKRLDPSLLLPDAKSILVFLAPFGSPNLHTPRLMVSEFAFGLDYHKVIKDKLYHVAQLLEEAGGKKCYRVFTDSAPVLERAWAIRAGVGFIGHNNFLISPIAGIKNFIGIIITTVELPYYQGEILNSSQCADCNLCIKACKQHALFAPFKIDARKCLSYKTIEASAESADTENSAPKTAEKKWIFGCDDCMNVCPWNKANKQGWEEFRVNEGLLGNTTPEFWNSLTEESFATLFEGTPLMRAGLKKIQKTINEE